MSRKTGPIVTDMLLGALAGVAAAWVMQQATGYLYKHEGKEVKEQEQEARRDEVAYGAVAGQEELSGLSGGGAVGVEKVARMARRGLSDEERKKLEFSVQYGLSMAAGAAYGALRHRPPGTDWGHGLAFGTVFWLLVDEVGNPLLGLTPLPGAFPWQTHMRGLVGHLVFGLVAEAVLGHISGTTGKRAARHCASLPVGHRVQRDG